MSRKFGSGTLNRVGTGKVENHSSATEKWAGSVAAQVATASTIKSVLTKTIPVDYVVCDPNNPRKLSLNQQQVIAIAKKYPIDKEMLETETQSEWLEDYVKRVAEGELLSGKSLGDLASLVSFAASLKSADRLLHPIVVIRNESTFNLIAGERRLLAHVLLGEATIAARIAENDYTRSEIERLQWEENVHRVDMSLSERIDHIKKMLESGEGIQKTSVTKLSKILGRSRAESQRYLAVLRYPTNILISAIRAGKVKDLQTAAALAQMSPNDLTLKLSGSPSRPAQDIPRLKFTAADQAPIFAQIILAAANHLKLESAISSYDLKSPKELNKAFVAIFNALGDK